MTLIFDVWSVVEYMMTGGVTWCLPTMSERGRLRPEGVGVWEGYGGCGGVVNVGSYHERGRLRPEGVRVIAHVHYGGAAAEGVKASLAHGLTRVL